MTVPDGYRPDAVVLVPAPRKPGDAPLLRAAVRYPSPPGSADWRVRSAYPSWSDLPGGYRESLAARGYTKAIYDANSWMIKGLNPDGLIPGYRVGLFTILEIRKSGHGCKVIVLGCDCGNVVVKDLDYFASHVPMMCRSACLHKIMRETQAT